MKRSTTRTLTTHTGSLPRPWDLVDLLLAKQAGPLPDPDAFDRRVREAVAEVVQKQVEAGAECLFVHLDVTIESGWQRAVCYRPYCGEPYG